MSVVEIYKMCEGCRGDGIVQKYGRDPYTCPDCGGSGRIFLADSMDLATILNSITGQVDAVIAEQISQREDLTAALSQIWNKVKDL